MFSKSVTHKSGRRRKMSRSKDRRVFGKTAQNTKRENYNGAPMRGGIRL